jgi:broad specificity phosphatase PhoE
MKWPNQLVVVRHGKSDYNLLKEQKAKSKLYQVFEVSWRKNYQSEETKMLARLVLQKLKLKHSDAKTPLTPEGIKQAQTTGARLKEIIRLPHVIFISPYLRTRQTFRNLKIGWPELAGAKYYFDERLREQEHGLSTLYNDWKIFCTMYPEQLTLYNLDGPYYYRYPQGENKCAVRERIRSWMNTIVRDFDGQNVLVISHHLTILSLRANFERLDDRQFLELDQHHKPINCGVTIYKGKPAEGKDGRLVLHTYNKKLY